MISIKDIILTFRNIKKEIDDIKERILYIPGPGDLIGSNFGELNKEYDGKYSEVTFLKGSKELIDGYAGSQGQVVVDYDTNDVYLMKGGGELGGIRLLKEGDATNESQVLKSIKVSINISNWINENGFMVCTINHNLDVNIEDLDVKFYNANTNVYICYEVIDKNNIKLTSNKEAIVSVYLKSFKQNNNNVIVINTLKNDWVDEGTVFTHIINHERNVHIENLDVKFYDINKSELLSYDFINSDAIKIYSDERVDVNTIIRKVL